MPYDGTTAQVENTAQHLIDAIGSKYVLTQAALIIASRIR